MMSDVKRSGLHLLGSIHEVLRGSQRSPMNPLSAILAARPARGICPFRPRKLLGHMLCLLGPAAWDLLTKYLLSFHRPPVKIFVLAFYNQTVQTLSHEVKDS